MKKGIISLIQVLFGFITVFAIVSILLSWSHISKKIIFLLVLFLFRISPQYQTNYLFAFRLEFRFLPQN